MAGVPCGHLRAQDRRADARRARARRAQEVARRNQSRAARHRLHHRHRHLRADGARRGAVRGPRDHHLVHHHGHAVRARRVVVRRARVGDPGVGLGVLVLVRVARRDRGVDHGRAARARVRPRRFDGRRRVVGLRRELPARLRARHTGRACAGRRALRSPTSYGRRRRHRRREPAGRDRDRRGDRSA